jgi:hypothetical protein
MRSLQSNKNALCGSQDSLSIFDLVTAAKPLGTF